MALPAQIFLVPKTCRLSRWSVSFDQDVAFVEPEDEQRVQVAVAALFLASAVLRLELQGVVVSDCSRDVDWLLVEG